LTHGQGSNWDRCGGDIVIGMVTVLHLYKGWTFVF
jgi:hypothetical protein